MTAKGPGSEEVPSSRAGATGACFPSESCLFIPPQGQLALGLTPWLPELLRGAVTFSAKARIFYQKVGEREAQSGFPATLRLPVALLYPCSPPFHKRTFPKSTCSLFILQFNMFSFTH